MKWWTTNKLYLLCFFICFRPVGIVANYSKNFQIMLSIRKELLGLFPTCWSITSHWWRDEQLNKLDLFGFLFVSNMLDKLQNTLSLNYCVELFKELFPTCWSTTSHWWSDEQLINFIYCAFSFVSDLLELLQTILKTFRLC